VDFIFHFNCHHISNDNLDVNCLITIVSGRLIISLYATERWFYYVHLSYM